MEHNPRNYEEGIDMGIVLGNQAEGAIAPTDEQLEQLLAVIEALQSERLYAKVEMNAIGACIDGRSGHAPSVCSAGASISLMVADDLTLRQFARQDSTTKEAYEHVLDYLAERDLTIAGHTDEHASATKSGCGASDNLPDIYRVMHEKSDAIREILAQLGVKVTDETNAQFVKQARARTSFSSSNELKDSTEARIGAANIPALKGGHNEAVIAINLRANTSLNREALAREFPDVQAFNVDVWAFEPLARELYSDATDDEITAYVTALLYFNVATALRLCGADMPVVVRE